MLTREEMYLQLKEPLPALTEESFSLLYDAMNKEKLDMNYILSIMADVFAEGRPELDPEGIDDLFKVIGRYLEADDQ